MALPAPLDAALPFPAHHILLQRRLRRPLRRGHWPRDTARAIPQSSPCAALGASDNAFGTSITTPSEHITLATPGPTSSPSTRPAPVPFRCAPLPGDHIRLFRSSRLSPKARHTPRRYSSPFRSSARCEPESDTPCRPWLLSSANPCSAPSPIPPTLQAHGEDREGERHRSHARVVSWRNVAPDRRDPRVMRSSLIEDVELDLPGDCAKVFVCRRDVVDVPQGAFADHAVQLYPIRFRCPSLERIAPRFKVARKRHRACLGEHAERVGNGLALRHHVQLQAVSCPLPRRVDRATNAEP